MSKTVKKILRIAFLIYVAVLMYVLLFSERNPDGTNGYNIYLFAEIKRYIRYRQILGMKLVVRNLVGNVLGFIPFGFLLPLLNEQLRKIWMIVLWAGGFSFIIELIQKITGVGCFDVDDIFLNTLGGFLGYLLWYSIRQIRKRYGYKKKETEKI